MKNYNPSRERKITNLHVIQAAGGLVWLDSQKGRQICIIYRSRYKDWTLPKGKLQSGEHWFEAALREAQEETGCEVKIEDYCGCTSYLVGGNPKVVLFWHMSVVSEGEFKPTKEIDRIEWVSSDTARIKLTYAEERDLLPNH
jgi:8-oxo-dGTP diphosphatase